MKITDKKEIQNAEEEDSSFLIPYFYFCIDLIIINEVKNMRWKYKFVEVHEPSDLIYSEKEFASLGEDGWELISVYKTATNQNYAIFKKMLERNY